MRITEMIVAQGLTMHPILLVVEKPERAVATQVMLTQAGYKIEVAVGLYEALRVIGQLMPHLVICEVSLADGSCVNLHDKLLADKFLAKIPVLAHSVKKSPEEIALIKSRKFAAAYAGSIDAKIFLPKISECINVHSPISPFYYGAKECGMEESLTLKIDSVVMGRVGEQILVRSKSEIDQAASMVCIPKNPDLSPAVLRMANNIRNGEEVFNLFPVGRIIGKGRTWLEKLPLFNMDASGVKPVAGAPVGTGSPRKLIFCDPNAGRFESFKEILGGYDIELVHAKTLSVAAGILGRGPDAFGGVYIHELLNDASSAEWKTSFAKIPLSSRPAIICGTTVTGAKNTDAMRFIKRPFGMGILVEMIESTFTRGSKIALVAGANAATQVTGTLVTLQAPAIIIGLDETGGVLQMKFPLAKGSKVEILHAEMASLLGGTGVTIVSVSAVANHPDLIQARFESIAPGMSKGKYWEKIAKTLAAKAAVVKEAEARAADPAA
jgi:CheY-like chemotaxis protein